jgi:oxygen-independent coproporphyrinogen-3 oxidase
LAQAAVKRVNIDLMYGLPAQSPVQFEHDLTTAISFGTEHLSLYQLTLEPQTVFAKYPPALPDEADLEAMESTIDKIAVGQGWQRYEVSAYAKPGAQCRHNLNYWQFGDYLGIGPGAHSKISSPERILRQARTRNPSQWMQSTRRLDGSHISEIRELAPSDLVFEFFLNGLRLVDGVAGDLFEAHTGLPLSQARMALDRASAKGLIMQSGGQIKATELGWRHLNDLQANFL